MGVDRRSTAPRQVLKENVTAVLWHVHPAVVLVKEHKLTAHPCNVEVRWAWNLKTLMVIFVDLKIPELQRETITR